MRPCIPLPLSSPDSGPPRRSAAVIRSPLTDLLAHAADEPKRQPGITVLAALHIAAARLGATASLVEEALALCGDPAVTHFPANDAITRAWKMAREQARRAS
jgi:hypothetical protein